MAQRHNIVEDKVHTIESTSSLSAMVKDSFFVWLSDGRAKKYHPTVYLSCIDKVSEYLIRRKISSINLWEITNFGLFKSIYNKAINDNLFKATDKKTHTVFVQVGKAFLKFLKSKPTIHNASSVPLKSSSHFVSRLTIKEAIIRVLEIESHGMTVEQIYEEIIADGLYSFGAKNPIDIVRGQIDRACVNSNYTIRASKNCFRFERNENGQKVYSLLTPTLTDNAAQPGISDEGEPAESEQEVFNTAVAKVDSQSITTHEPQFVDFTHPEFCTDCDPISCIVEGNDFSGGNWRDVLVALTEVFLQSKPKAMKLYHTSLYPNGEHEFLLKDRPKFSARQLSNGYWVNVNLSIKDLVFTIGRLCQFCGVDLNDVSMTYVPKQSAGGIRPMNIIKDDSARFAQQTVRDAFRAWLTTHNPEWSSRTVTMHYSDAYYLYNNKRGITLEVALTADDGLQKAYDAIERFYTDNPTQTNNPSGAARGYLRSLRMLKEFLDEKYPELLSANSASISAPSVPDAAIDVLKKNYASGFRFDTTYINLLSSASGVEVDGRMQSALKRIMFRRDDGIYFLLDIVADSDTREDIIDFADTYLQEYGCFEIPEFYKLYEDKVNPNCIRNADDFESFYEQIGKSGVRCVQAPYVGNRIARYSNSGVWSTFKDVAAKIVSVITEEYELDQYHSVNPR
ncbi:MAG: HTH domain-containing protein [Phycisphaerales bacterium]